MGAESKEHSEARLMPAAPERTPKVARVSSNAEGRMMVTFQSRAAPEVMMLRDQAEYLLGLIGRRLDVQGVIMHDDLRGSIKRLEREIAR
jgi:hypothetical protein